MSALLHSSRLAPVRHPDFRSEWHNRSDFAVLTGSSRECIQVAECQVLHAAVEYRHIHRMELHAAGDVDGDAADLLITGGSSARLRRHCRPAQRMHRCSQIRWRRSTTAQSNGARMVPRDRHFDGDGLADPGASGSAIDDNERGRNIPASGRRGYLGRPRGSSALAIPASTPATS